MNPETYSFKRGHLLEVRMRLSSQSAVGELGTIYVQGDPPIVENYGQVLSVRGTVHLPTSFSLHIPLLGSSHPFLVKIVKAKLRGKGQYGGKINQPWVRRIDVVVTAEQAVPELVMEEVE